MQETSMKLFKALEGIELTELVVPGSIKPIYCTHAKKDAYLNLYLCRPSNFKLTLDISVV